MGCRQGPGPPAAEPANRPAHGHENHTLHDGHPQRWRFHYPQCQAERQSRCAHSNKHVQPWISMHACPSTHTLVSRNQAKIPRSARNDVASLAMTDSNNLTPNRSLILDSSPGALAEIPRFPSTPSTSIEPGLLRASARNDGASLGMTDSAGQPRSASAQRRAPAATSVISRMSAKGPSSDVTKPIEKLIRSRLTSLPSSPRVIR